MPKTVADMMLGKVCPPWLAAEREKCRHSVSRFNRVVLNRPPFWSKQAEVAESFRTHRQTLCMSGNSTGKSFTLGTIALWYAAMHPHSKVVITAPSENQLRNVAWTYIAKAFHDCPYRLFPQARIYKQPLKIEIAEDWFIIGYSTKKKENLTGFHAEHLAFIVDEASGVEREIYEGLDSLNPHRVFMIGNPLRPYGVFYDRCSRAMRGEDPNTNLIKIKSTDSPDAGVQRSARGLADKGWLEAMKTEWGENSVWWDSHVDANFPKVGGDILIPVDWAERCLVPHRFGGERRIAIDLAKGKGGDKSFVICGDDNGVIDYWESNSSDLATTAWKAFEMRQRWNVSDHRITWDQHGIGIDFAFRLRQVGIVNPTPYMGGQKVKSDSFINWRGYSHWKFRRRLDPTGMFRIQYAMPQKLVNELIPQLEAVSYTEDGTGKVVITPADEVRERLGFSPDALDCMSQLFCFAA
jgi:phage terminase large subunit